MGGRSTGDRRDAGGIFSKFSDRASALVSMVAGVAAACALQVARAVGIPWAHGLTSGAVAMGIKLAVHVGLALAAPHTAAARMRLDALFAGLGLSIAPAASMDPPSL